MGVKRTERESDHSPPSSAVGQRMSGAIPPVPNTPPVSTIKMIYSQSINVGTIMAMKRCRHPTQFRTLLKNRKHHTHVQP